MVPIRFLALLLQAAVAVVVEVQPLKMMGTPAVRAVVLVNLALVTVEVPVMPVATLPLKDMQVAATAGATPLPVVVVQVKLGYP
jgi:hypothetical protein